ncbi:MAG: VapE domain-containing protein [Methyloceanibacter sp.]
MPIDFDAIRRQFPLVEQVARYGSKVDRHLKFRCLIPGHKDKTPSANIIREAGSEDRWYCHVCSKGGDVVDLEAEVHGIADRGDAARHLWGQGELPQLRDMGKPKPKAPNRPETRREKLGLAFALGLVPADAPQIRAGAETPPILSKHGSTSVVVPADVYTYYNLANERVGLVLRIEKPDGGKKHVPVRWEINLKRWVWAGWAGDDVAPLYNAPAIARRQDATVVMLEGEKCAKLAKELLVDYVATCWAGGTGGIRKADLALLKGRTVIFWPDADEGGKKAMREAAQKAWAAKSLWVEPSPDWPAGHDIADVIKDEGVAAAADRLKAAEPFIPESEKPALPPPGSWLRLAQGGWVPDEGYIDLTKEGTLSVRSELNGFTALKNHPRFARIGWDVIRRCVMDGDRVIADGDDIRALQVALAEHTQVRLGIETFGKLLGDVAMKRPVNPLADRLRALPWDGVKRPLHTYAGVKDTPWNRAAFDRWFLGVIARIFEPGCQHDLTLILEGEQGPKKTSFLRALASPCGFDGYTEMPHLALASNDLMQLDGKLIVELGEMTAYRKSDRESFKAALTSRVDRYRRPYASTFIDVPRTTVFAGTTNQLDNYLNDATGNRRFVPVRCREEARVADLERDLDQIYAEAIVRYTALRAARAEVNWFTPAELELQREMTTRRELPSVLADRLEERLEAHLLETIEPELVWVDWLGLSSMRDRKPFQTELVEEMRRRGWIRAKGTTREDRRRLWRRLKQEAGPPKP